MPDGEPGQADAIIEVLDQLDATTARLVDAVADLDVDELLADSQLPGWSRLTILCHLRYGAVALRQMTRDVLAGRPSSYYPDGRDAQRPATLVPGEGEQPLDVVRSLSGESTTLSALWHTVGDWDARLEEPPDRIDLGPVTLRQLAILRLTEVEVHGTDLGIGLGPWSDRFVSEALAMRLAWLPSRPGRGEVDGSDGAWLLVSTDEGTAWQVAVSGSTVTSRHVSSADDADAGTVVEATSRELLALLLGRQDIPGADEFRRHFPGP